jgi:hypothetical protein
VEVAVECISGMVFTDLARIWVPGYPTHSVEHTTQRTVMPVSSSSSSCISGCFGNVLVFRLQPRRPIIVQYIEPTCSSISYHLLPSPLHL